MYYNKKSSPLPDLGASSPMTDGKREIKIYQKTYQLPVLSGGNLDKLQKQIRKRNEHLSQGKLVVKKVEQRGFLGKKIIEERVCNPLSFQERYQELNAIVLRLYRINPLLQFPANHSIFEFGNLDKINRERHLAISF